MAPREHDPGERKSFRIDWRDPGDLLVLGVFLVGGGLALYAGARRMMTGPASTSPTGGAPSAVAGSEETASGSSSTAPGALSAAGGATSPGGNLSATAGTSATAAVRAELAERRRKIREELESSPSSSSAAPAGASRPVPSRPGSAPPRGEPSASPAGHSPAPRPRDAQRVTGGAVASVPPPAPRGSGGGDSSGDPKKTDPPVDPSSDTHPPVVRGITFQPGEVKDGDEAMVLIDVADDLSGVKYVSGTLSSPNAKAMVGFSAQAAGAPADAGGFASKVRIPKDAEAGRWYVSNLNTSDRAGNVGTQGFAAQTSPWGIVVSSSKSDVAPPNLESVYVDKSSVQEGERQSVQVRATDDSSGIASISGLFTSPSKTATVGFGCRAGSDPNVWVGEFAIPKGADCGDWTLTQVTLTDVARNMVNVTGTDPRIQRVSFYVQASGTCDSVPPNLDQISLSPSIVSNAAASEVIVTILASDNATGVRSVTGRVDGPTPQGGRPPTISFGCQRNGTDPASPWIGKVTIPQFAAKGIWKVAWLQLLDGANNSRILTANDPALSTAIIQVQ